MTICISSATVATPGDALSSTWDAYWDAWKPDPPQAQTAGALESFRQMGVAYVQVSTAGDGNVCPACRAAEAHGPYPVGRPPAIPLCDDCRCALVAALQPLPDAR
jgi:hypothetical protein